MSGIPRRSRRYLALPACCVSVPKGQEFVKSRCFSLAPATDRTLRRFQDENGLTADGVAGPQTMRKLKEFQVSPDEKPGNLGIAQVPEVKNAARNFGPLALFATARDQIAEIATYATGINSDLANTIANGLLAVSGAIGLGLTAWGIYGWWKSKQTVEQA